MTDLSPRQLEIARLVAEGLTDQEIANLVQATVRTVQTHLDRIVKRLGLDAKRNRRVLITRWIEQYEKPTPPSSDVAA